MTIDFKLPELGENITSGDIVNVLVARVSRLRPTTAWSSWKRKRQWWKSPARRPARVAKIHVKKGDTVKVGQTLLTLESRGGVPRPSQRQRDS